MLIKEYRICMPLTVEEYQIGQLYMIARHSSEQSENGEGVETIANTQCEDEKYGIGQFTEKRIYLSNRLPYWLQSLIPKIFYVTEKAWNYYPYTITEYTALDLSEERIEERTVDFIDIAYDEINAKHYKEEEDLKFFKSKKTDRGPLFEDWQKSMIPIMCSYKVVEASFEVWGMQTRCEELIQRSIRDVLVLGHRQAFAWIDEWISMSLADVRMYECEMQRETNTKVVNSGEKKKSIDGSHKSSSSSSKTSTPTTPKSPTTAKSWFLWD